MLLSDSIPLVFTLHEASNEGGFKKLRGLFHLAETKNANGRIYPKKLLEREMKKILPAIKERRILGEINHPMDPQINLEKSSHVITQLKMDGNKIFGELEILKTPAGKVLEGLIDSGVKLGISSRGLGSLKEVSEGGSTVKMVQNDYGLITWDVVANPSTPGAWMDESANAVVIDMDQPLDESEVEMDLVEFGASEVVTASLVESYIITRCKEIFE